MTAKLELTSHKVLEEVYVIMSPEGGIGLSFGGKGTCYTNLADAEGYLKSKNEWSKARGYGVYHIIPLEIDKIEKGELICGKNKNY